ncbi:MAG: alanine racemase [Gallionella sp.]|jgi:alanine racemase
MFQTPTLTIDLSAIIANWHLLRGKFTGDECAAVVKADAYGLGMVEVATALSDAGCHSFFVATADEAVRLRDALPDVRILVFHGVQEGEEFAFANRRIIPVLNSREQIARWQPVAAEHIHAVSALHIDTAMGRLGLQPNEFGTLLEKTPDLLAGLRTGLILSHFACAPERDHPLNRQQLQLFRDACARAPGIPASLCNSGGIFLGPDFHFHLARPGCSLYGIAPASGEANPMQQVAIWEAPILQLRTLERDQTIGYGATASAPKGTKIATVASGYADGYLRSLSNKAAGYIGKHRVKLIGRVTMDMLCFDVTAVPDAALNTATHIELLGDKDGIRVDDVADAAGTIGYEILTRIGARVRRIYGSVSV